MSKRSGAVLDRALADELGADISRDATGPTPPLGAHSDPPRLRPRAARRRYVRAADHAIAYAGGGLRNELDVWRHPDLPLDANAPVVIQIHGGAWAVGNNRGQAIPLLTRLAEHGWICVAPNYRLSPKHRWPAHIVDINRVIAWTKANIAVFGGDPDFIAVTGGSAGGHLSSLAALCGDHDQFKPGFAGSDTTVQAAAPYYGAYDWLDRDATANPNTQKLVADKVIGQPIDAARSVFDHGSSMSWIGGHAPPFFVLHGRNDALLPVKQARSFVHALRSVSTAPVAYAELPVAQHAFDIVNSPRARHAAAAVEKFLAAVWHHHREGTELPVRRRE